MTTSNIRSLLVIVAISMSSIPITSIEAANMGPTISCFDCFDTGPTNTDCTYARNCTGIACLLYESGDNRTSTAFCLLTMRGMEIRDNTPNGCWLEPDGRGKHCICKENFCNRLRDRTSSGSAGNDPFNMPLPHASFLKKNPLIDYEDVDTDADLGLNSRPIPENLLFPAAAEIDQTVAGGGKKKVELGPDDDLVPMDVSNYDYEQDQIPSANNNRHAYHSSPGQMIEDRTRQQTRLTHNNKGGQIGSEPDSAQHSTRISFLTISATVSLFVVQRL